MSKREDGGPAFPGYDPKADQTFHGMSMRDWFAGQALIGLAMRGHVSHQEAAQIALRYADAMLKAREVE